LIRAVVARVSRTPRRTARAGPWAWSAAGAVLGALFALLVFAPARWLAEGVAQLSHGEVLLADPRGTIWGGSGHLVLSGGRGSTDAAALPGRVSWSLRPLWDGVAARVQADCCTTQPLSVRAQWRLAGWRVQVGDGASQWPAAVLAGLGTPWNTLQLDGEVALSTRGLSVEWVEGRPRIEGRAELVAQRVASRLSTLRPMGSYRITLQGGTQASLRLETLEGSLRLSGTGEWVGQRLRFRGEATAVPGSEAALANLLNIIGRRSGDRSIITIG
jgi:general secretion pathway protein N